MSPDGYISITGRIKDLIIRGGENIHPLEIENCLFAHPSVSSVSVVGVPDDRYGEVVAAFVIQREEAERKLTADEVKDWVRKKLSHHLGKFSSFPSCPFAVCTTLLRCCPTCCYACVEGAVQL